LEYHGAKQVCEISRDIASRILCLPIYPSLAHNEVLNIVRLMEDG